jgi:hypothetical protein
MQYTSLLAFADGMLYFAIDMGVHLACKACKEHCVHVPCSAATLQVTVVSCAGAALVFIAIILYFRCGHLRSHLLHIIARATMHAPSSATPLMAPTDFKNLYAMQA